MEGADYRFAVLVVSMEDKDWVDRVLSEVDARIRSNTHWNMRRLARSRPGEIRRFFQDSLARVLRPA